MRWWRGLVGVAVGPAPSVVGRSFVDSMIDIHNMLIAGARWVPVVIKKETAPPSRVCSKGGAFGVTVVRKEMAPPSRVCSEGGARCCCCRKWNTAQPTRVYSEGGSIVVYN
jgi:hypothetical protein